MCATRSKCTALKHWQFSAFDPIAHFVVAPQQRAAVSATPLTLGTRVPETLAHLVVAPQQLQRAAAVPRAPELGVHRDAHDARAAQRREVRILELLAHRPGDQVALAARRQM